MDHGPKVSTCQRTFKRPDQNQNISHISQLSMNAYEYEPSIMFVPHPFAFSVSPCSCSLQKERFQGQGQGPKEKEIRPHNSQLTTYNYNLLPT